ncbi:MAG TPA: metallophosphoesterase [Terriglobales bacterium]|nr:metallophosphoesterase [Terriglobales bacterium]
MKTSIYRLLPSLRCRWVRAALCGLFVVIVTACAFAAPQPGPATQRFLIASDLHFNPMADPKLVDQLSGAAPTQWEAILERSQPMAFSQYGQDTNWWLLRSALDAMRRTLPNPPFILLTGDMLAHNFSSKYRETATRHDAASYRSFVLKTMEFLSLQLRKRFSRAPILLTPGNNDDDCGDYGIEAGGAFLHDTAELVRKLARSDAELASAWDALGSYDIPHPALRSARIISLNTVFFSNKYQAQEFGKGCANVSSSAPDDLFAWFEARLGRAQQAHEKVWLMFHIPPGMDGFSSLEKYEQLVNNDHDSPAQACSLASVPMWTPKWTTRFDELLAKYQDTIVAAFAGHTHTDWFQVLNASASEPGFVLINPSISPVYNQNPSFRVGTFSNGGTLSDQSVYYLTNLIFAGKSTPGEWKREYTFSSEWKLGGITGANLSKLYRDVASEDAAQSEWLKLLNASSSAAHLPPESAPALYCPSEALTPESYTSCFCSAVSKRR